MGSGRSRGADCSRQNLDFGLQSCILVSRPKLPFTEYHKPKLLSSKLETAVDASLVLVGRRAGKQNRRHCTTTYFGRTNTSRNAMRMGSRGLDYEVQTCSRIRSQSELSGNPAARKEPRPPAANSSQATDSEDDVEPDAHQDMFAST